MSFEQVRPAMAHSTSGREGLKPGVGHSNNSVVHVRETFSKHTLIEICPFEKNKQ